MKQTNFSRYLQEQLANPTFARRMELAAKAWDAALKKAASKRDTGKPQKKPVRGQ